MIVNFFCSTVDCCCCNCFDMLRGDVYGYMYLTGDSYCQSARQCQYLCDRSEICEENQSTNSVYSLAARLVIALSTVLITYWIGYSTLSEAQENPYSLIGAFFISLFISCYFVDIHIDIAEAILITFLCEYDVEQENYKGMNICRDTVKDELDHILEIN